MQYYHATTVDNALQINNDGEIKTGCDGIVYLADSPENAVKFVAIRGHHDVVVYTIDVPDESLVEETFDHSLAFFKCKAYGYPENIDLSYVKEAFQYTLNF